MQYRIIDYVHPLYKDLVKAEFETERKVYGTQPTYPGLPAPRSPEPAESEKEIYSFKDFTENVHKRVQGAKSPSGNDLFSRVKNRFRIPPRAPNSGRKRHSSRTAGEKASSSDLDILSQIKAEGVDDEYEARTPDPKLAGLDWITIFDTDEEDEDSDEETNSSQLGRRRRSREQTNYADSCTTVGGVPVIISDSPEKDEAEIGDKPVRTRKRPKLFEDDVIILPPVEEIASAEKPERNDSEGKPPECKEDKPEQSGNKETPEIKSKADEKEAKKLDSAPTQKQRFLQTIDNVLLKWSDKSVTCPLCDKDFGITGPMRNLMIGHMLVMHKCRPSRWSHSCTKCTHQGTRPIPAF